MKRLTIDELLERSDISDTVRRQLQRIAGENPVPGQAANVEPHHRNALLGPKKAEGYHGPVIIVITEKRHKLTDYNGGSEKYVVDAIVTAKVLQDDCLAIVKKIIKEQVKIPNDEAEETVIEIWKVKQ